MEENNKKSNISIMSYLDNLSPYEFSLLANVFAYVISIGLTPGQQNSIGNWFELVGQVLLTISAQASTTPTVQEYNQLVNDVNELKNKLLSNYNIL